MMKLDHLNLPVRDVERSRAWYQTTLGLKLELDIPDRRTVAVNDGDGFAIFLQERKDVSPRAASIHVGSYPAALK